MAKRRRVKKTEKKAIQGVPSDTFAPIRKELELAYRRIDGTPTRRLQWLLNFSELDLDSLSEGRLADLRWEVLVFGLGKKPEQMTSRFEIFYEFYALTSPVPLNKQIPLSEIEKHFPKPASEEEHEARLQAQESERRKGATLWLVKEFQDTLRQIFDTLFAGEWWRFKRPVQEETIALSHITDKDGSRKAHNPPAYTAEDLLMIQTIDLIKAEWQRLTICQNPYCEKRFVAAKKGRASFHSSKCSAYVRVNKARGWKSPTSRSYKNIEVKTSSMRNEAGLWTASCRLSPPIVGGIHALTDLGSYRKGGFKTQQEAEEAIWQWAKAEIGKRNS
jgi:hypothetical protein